MSIFNKLFGRKKQGHEQGQGEKQEERKDEKQKNEIINKKPLSEQPLSSRNSSMPQLSKIGGTMEIVRYDSPIGQIRIDHENQNIIVDKKTYDNIVILRSQNLSIIPYAKLGKNEISDVVFINTNKIFMRDVIDEKMYGINYTKTVPYAILPEEKKDEVKKILFLFPSFMRVPAEIDVTEEIRRKLASATIIERKEKMTNFQLNKFIDAIKNAKKFEKDKYVDITLIEVEKDGKRLRFLLFENPYLEMIYERGEEFASCDHKRTVKLNYENSQAWLILFTDDKERG